MANLPDTKTRSSKPTRADKLRQLIRKGYTGPEIAKKLHPDDPRKRKQVRHEVRRVMAMDEEYKAMQTLAMQGSIIEQIPEATDAVMRRAKRGRVDAYKLALEVSGIHNPRIQHEHSGDIAITLNLPRPVDAEATAVTDAEVVELNPGKE